MADLNDREEGGLFSDDYEIPKRENPYKKKKSTSEALTDEPQRKDKRKDRAKRSFSALDETEDEQQAPSQEPESLTEDEDGVHMPKRYRSLKDRWNDFIFRHVKLFVFICCMIGLLLFIAAPAIYYGVQDAREAAEIASKDPLTMTYVKGLADKSAPITWSDLVSFPYDETVASDSVTWMIKVKDTNFEVWVSGTNTQTLPAYVYLYDMGTGDKVDLTKDLLELEEFLAGRD